MFFFNNGCLQFRQSNVPALIGHSNIYVKIPTHIACIMHL